MRKAPFIIFIILVVWAYINIFQLPYFAWTFPLTQNWFADNGLIEFKDVIYHHTPLPLLILYGMSKILGNNFFMLQISSFLMLILFGYGIYLTAKQISKRVGIMSFFIFIISFSTLFNNFNIEEMTSSLFALWAFYFFIKFYKTISYKFIFFFGALLSLSFMGKQPSILVLFPLAALLIMFRKNRGILLKKTFIYLALGLFIAISPFVFYFYANNALYDLYYWNIIFNFTIYPSLSKVYAVKEGITSTLWLLFSIAPALFIIFKEKIEESIKFILIALITTTIFLLPSFFPSFWTYKALIFYPYPVILWSIVFLKIKNKFLFLSVIMAGLFFIPLFKGFYIDYLPYNIFHKEYILDYTEDELRVVNWLKKNTQKNEKIMNIGNHYILTLAQRLPANKYVYIFPWLVYPYEESTKEILYNPPRVVILDSRIYEDWPSVEKEWRLISEIRSTYKKEINFGTYNIYIHK